MLTKTNYEHIATIVRKERHTLYGETFLYGETLVKKLAQYFRYDNPNFDWDKFIKACEPRKVV